MINLWPVEDEQKLYDYIHSNVGEGGKVCWARFLETFPEKTVNQGQAKFFRMRQETERWNFRFLRRKQTKDGGMDIAQVILRVIAAME
ncbi:hypothetical protein SS50377_27137 [Spironucleus salmonicida]|uniref:Myb-like DNA-binding domain-containing protein n=1 Tax=Spironucleus salmonicida TaxID=348837 RepID=V6LJ76_9EUKA|nr:hypothetical protein SS50377_27136 [Spironucleus salmonicida]KAH0570845.1 hypothetical protein SS50377_27137 [Spironucleus salmonicida]|eukprot:EST43736.1 Hypothetical protein SS50377_16468 [Spironucleus salmonicida]